MKLKFHRVGLELAHPWKIARTERTSRIEVVLVEVRTPEGIVGYGEAAPVSRYGESVETVERFLSEVPLHSLSEDEPLENIRRLEAMESGNMAAKCALDLALFDIAGKKSGKSVFELLGLNFTEHQHLTSFTIGIDSSDVIKSKVIDAERFSILKIKMGVSQDRENLRALREVAPTKTVRVDANEGWKTKEEALEKINWLAVDPHIQFVEQPLPAAAPVEDWAWLKERSPLPIFADESYQTAADVGKAAECFHGVNVKLVKTGGIAGAFDALTAARKAGLKTMLGCMIETSVLISAAAQLAELCDYLDLDGNLLITNDPFKGVIEKNGTLSFADAPTATGLCVAPRSD